MGRGREGVEKNRNGTIETGGESTAEGKLGRRG